MVTWAIATGEYPPQAGGVGDYARQVAVGLARAGCEVHVFAPGYGAVDPGDPGVSVHRLARGFLPHEFGRLGSAWDSLPVPRRILVQFVPQAFGLKGLNLPFCLWCRMRRREPLDVMFHEVAMPWGHGVPLRHRALSAAQRLMARILGTAADRIFVSTQSWERVLRSVGVTKQPVCLPIPTNLPTEVDRSLVAAARRRLDREGHRLVIGHFGTYGDPVARLLADTLARILIARPDRLGALFGRGSQRFATYVAESHPFLRDQVAAYGELPARDAAVHLAACDLLLQPFPDGVTTRRTSLMAGLALGVPVVTNAGPLTEPFWLESAGVAIAASAAELAGTVDLLLNDPERRRACGVAGAKLYESRFSLSQSIEALLAWEVH